MKCEECGIETPFKHCSFKCGLKAKQEESDFLTQDDMYITEVGA